MSGEINLLAAAKAVMENWESGDLAEAVRKLSDAVKEAEEARADTEEIQRARNLYGNDECEIDDDAQASRAPGEGVWVQAWVWLSEDDCGEL